jgi:ABC-type transporter Mla subunit MlaD
MAVQRLLDELEALVEKSGRVPWVGRKAVVEHKFYDLLSKVRQALPEELEKAATLVRERDRVVNETRAQAEAIITEARKAAARLVEQNEIIKQASQSASELMHQAEVAAESVRADAVSFAQTILDRVEQHLARLRAAVVEGRRAIAPPAEATEAGKEDASH